MGKKGTNTLESLLWEKTESRGVPEIQPLVFLVVGGPQQESPD